MTPPPTPVTTAPPAPVDVPSADAAASIAQSLLNRFGVLSGQQSTQSVGDGGGVAVSCTPGATCTPTPATVTARIVTFDLVVDGVSVPDVSWSVSVGEHRSIESVSGTWARPESAGSYRLRSTQKVFGDLRAREGSLCRAATPARHRSARWSVTPGSVPAVVVHITGVSLGMARWDGMEKTQPVVYLLPTYRFQAHVAAGSAYTIELLALDPATFSFVSQPAPGGASGGVVAKGATVSPGKTPEPTSRPQAKGFHGAGSRRGEQRNRTASSNTVSSLKVDRGRSARARSSRAARRRPDPWEGLSTPRATTKPRPISRSGLQIVLRCERDRSRGSRSTGSW